MSVGFSEKIARRWRCSWEDVSGHARARARAQAVGTYRGQFGDDDGEGGEEVDHKVRQVVVGVVRRDEEEDDGDGEEELFRRRVLISTLR